MSWFKGHLNWTYLFSFIVYFALTVVDIYLLGEIGVLMGLGLILLVIAPFWVIRQKGRSLWNMCWCFLGILPIVVLCLENRAQEA